MPRYRVVTKDCYLESAWVNGFRRVEKYLTEILDCKPTYSTKTSQHYATILEANDNYCEADISESFEQTIPPKVALMLNEKSKLTPEEKEQITEKYPARFIYLDIEIMLAGYNAEYVEAVMEELVQKINLDEEQLRPFSDAKVTRIKLSLRENLQRFIRKKKLEYENQDIIVV